MGDWLWEGLLDWHLARLLQEDEDFLLAKRLRENSDKEYAESVQLENLEEDAQFHRDADAREKDFHGLHEQVYL